MSAVDGESPQEGVWTVGTRRSALATTQTRQILERLRRLRGGVSFTVREIVTRGDRIQDVPLAEVGGKGLFISELEAALAEGRIDFAVHSMKDVPAQLAPGLLIAAVPAREDARDVLISRAGCTVSTLPANALVGTSSLRRSVQLRRLRPDLRILPLRGNIDTRLRKLAGLDAIVLAAAGLRRMEWWTGGTALAGQEGARVVPIAVSDMVPAAGQGALAVECREDDARLRELLGLLHDANTAACVAAERAFLDAVGGSCQVPVGAHAVFADDGRALQLTALVGAPDGSAAIRETLSGADPFALGRAAAKRVLEQGGAELLKRWEERA